MQVLRPFQKTALLSLGPPDQPSHVICVAPTGSGKSLIYETAAQSPKRRTVLISPLIALARQQFQNLSNLSAPVTLSAGGSSQGPPQCQSGIWIISPEILHFESKQTLLRNWNPNLLVVDECHCLWEWGDHFRPAFLLIPKLLEELQIVQSLWLTATLPYDARNHLKRLLPAPVKETGNFDLPPQLKLNVRKLTWSERLNEMIQWIQCQSTPGIIFVSTRDSTLRIARLIAATGKKILIYHGGMSSEERKNAEAQVHNNIPDIIIATSAFGMGMNYPQLTYVILWQAPTSILSLVQIIGRVGRNQNSLATATIYWDLDDFRLLEWTVKNSEKRRQEMEELLWFLNSNQCRRASLKTYFDRESHPDCQNKCDYCVKT